MVEDEGRLATRQARHCTSVALTAYALVLPRGVAMHNSGVDISGTELLFDGIIAGSSLPVTLLSFIECLCTAATVDCELVFSHVSLISPSPVRGRALTRIPTMDQGSSGNRSGGTLPRLSRLPKIVPRASHDSLNQWRDTQAEDPVKTSHLPRPSRPNASKIVPPTPLGENINRSVRERYGWSDAEHSRTRHRSPVRDALQAAQSAALDTTPPNSGAHLPVFEDGDENPQAVPQADVGASFDLGKRRPRPSLTERTMETLASIPASPSPNRRRASSAATRDGGMGPPARPASSMRNSRPNTPLTGRPPSPSKATFRPPGRMSPTKPFSLPAVPSPGSLYTPPRAWVKGGSARFTASNATSQSNGARETSKLPAYSSKTMRIKSSGRSGSGASGARDGKIALDSIFKDPAKPASTPKLRSSVSSSSLLRPRSHGENTIARSPPSSIKTRTGANQQANSPPSSSKSPTSIPGKSSAALRETIAKAKAAKKATGSSKPAVSTVDSLAMTGFGTDSWPGEPLVPGESNEGLLRKRLRDAVTSGTLNLVAMGLDAIPDDVMTMYETSTGTAGWSEMVDLTKFNMGDNKIEAISDRVFPDWSAEEMYEDDEKANQFAGLESMDLRNNLLRTIPLGIRRMERLASLALTGNNLDNAVLDTIWQIPQLQTLYLGNNNLTGRISFGSIKTRQLRVLDLSKNNIEVLEVKDGELPALQKIDVSSNKLGQLPWAGLASCELVELNASSNRLAGTAFEDVDGGFQKMREVDLSHNSITCLAAQMSEFSALQALRVNNNGLEALPDVSRWEGLLTLQAAENKLTATPSIWGLPTLKNVDLGQNNLKTIDARIATMETLTSLVLAGNPLRERKFLTMPTADLKLALEKRLDVSKDGASEHEQGSGAIPAQGNYAHKAKNGVLDLSSQSLDSVNPDTIDFSSSTIPIHTLRLQNNDFTTLPTELLCHPALKWSLKSLDLSHNPRLHSTTYLTTEIFLPVLQSLYVVSTGLTSLDALTTHLKAPELIEVNISCHRLAGHLPWVRAWYPKVTTVLASDNWFSSVDVEGVKGLEVLDIRNNQIEGLPTAIGLLGNHAGQREAGRLRSFESGGNLFRSPRIAVVDKGTEAVLADLRRMVPASAVPEEWKDEI